MRKLFAPGCALMLYKPELADKIYKLLNEKYECEGVYETCCHNKPDTDEKLLIINTCPGCDRRYSSLYSNVSTISLWEILADDPDLTLPQYNNISMAIHDACPTRKNDTVHEAIRKLAERMSIKVTEPERTKRNSVCCGDTFYKKLPAEQVLEKMTERASEMPEDDVIVYCVSCVHSMTKGGKKARYLPDLLFGEETNVKEETTEEWHNRIESFIISH